jgi:hypothetical protein
MFLKHVIIVIVPLVLFISCERVKYFPDNPVDFEKTYLLAHRGSGARDDGNTLNGCILGLNSLDCYRMRYPGGAIKNHLDEPCIGIGIVWRICRRFFYRFNDDRIVEIDSCLGLEKTFSQLERCLIYGREILPTNIYSLDAKPWFPCEVITLIIIRQMDQMANEIIRFDPNVYHPRKPMYWLKPKPARFSLLH